jgi:hypothetical protein
MTSDLIQLGSVALFAAFAAFEIAMAHARSRAERQDLRQFLLLRENKMLEAINRAYRTLASACGKPVPYEPPPAAPTAPAPEPLAEDVDSFIEDARGQGATEDELRHMIAQLPQAMARP